MSFSERQDTHPDGTRREPSLSADSLHRLYLWLSSVSVILFLAACFFSLDSLYFRPLRELNRVSGIEVLSYNPYKDAVVTRDVGDIEFNDVQVTAEHLQIAQQFPNLTWLRFYSCTIPPDAIEQLGELPRLRWIVFVDCEMDISQFLALWEAIPGLETVKFIDMNIQPGDFQQVPHWRNLDDISLRGSAVTSADIRDVLKAPSIERIDLGKTEIRDEAIASLVEAGGLSIISLDQTNLTDAQVSKLCDCQNLRVLDIHETEVTSSVLSDLARSKSLERVYASGSPLGSGFDENYLENGCVVHGSGKKILQSKSK